MTIEFEWDALKNQRNKIERGLDFEDAVEIVKEPVFYERDNRRDYGEDRFIAAGLLGERLVLVIYTWRADKVIRIISFRKANKRERKIYQSKVEI